MLVKVGGNDKGVPMIAGETYKQTRVDLGLSRADVSAMAKRAGHNVSQSSVDRLERRGSAAMGRGLSPGAVGWIEYLYGMSDPAGVVRWAGVERGAPVIVHHEKGAYQFQGVNGDGSISVFGGRRNEEKFRSFPAARVRLVTPTALPPPESAAVFEHRYKGSDSAYAQRIMNHIRATPGAHSVGAMAYMLGMNNAVVSRVAAELAKKGHLHKIARGVFVLPEPTKPVSPPTSPTQPWVDEPLPMSYSGEEIPDEDEELERESVKSAVAERIMAPGRRASR
jgi:hypothetical protein